MNDVMISVIVGCFTAIVASLTTYMVARKNHSGSVDTSEAAQLWDESQAMRKELRDETIRLRQEVEKWRKQAEHYAEEAVKLRNQIVLLRGEVSKLQSALDQYKSNGGENYV